MNPAVYCDLLPGLTTAHYRQAAEDISNLLTSQPGVECVSQFGDVGYPGISDIDLIVYVSHNAPRLSMLFEQWREADPIRKFMFYHSPLWIPTGFAPLLDRFHPGAAGAPEESHSTRTANSVWASAVMVIAARILLERSPVSARAMTLVYKNLLESCVRLKAIGNSEAHAMNLSLRDGLREFQLANGINARIPDSFVADFRKALEQLVYALQSANAAAGSSRIRPFRRIAIEQGHSAAVSRHGNNLTIRLKGAVIDDMLGDSEYTRVEATAIRAFREKNLRFPFYTRFCINRAAPLWLQSSLHFAKNLLRPNRIWLHDSATAANLNQFP